MRLLLVDNLLFEVNATDPAFDLQPHLGLLSLIAVARAHGHVADVFDPKQALVDGHLKWTQQIYEDAATLILNRGPDVVGFTALGCNFHCVVQIAAELHRCRPELPIILGGPHATILDREILRAFPMFSAVARHEAERSLIPLMTFLNSDRLQDIPGITWRRSDGAVVQNPQATEITDLDELPISPFDIYPAQALLSGAVRVEAGRGCPFSCSFCSTASFFGRSYRLKSPDRIVREMDYLYERYGITNFKLNHDLFTVNRRKVLAFCSAVAERGYTWGCSARVDCVDEELLTSMAEAGCRSIYFGIETGSPSMQAKSRKRLDLALVDPTLEIVDQLGIQTTTSFIIGFPEEDVRERAETIDVAGRLHLRARNTSQIHMLTPEPGTDLLARYRNTLLFDGTRAGLNLPRFAASDDELIAAHPELFVTHFHFASCVDHRLNVAATALWQQFSILDKSIYGTLLGRWKGQLSRLLDEASQWWLQENPSTDSPAPDALVDFFLRAFSRADTISSVLRHAQAARSLPVGYRGLPLARNRSDLVAPALAAGVAVLRDIHDVTAEGFALGGSAPELKHLVVLRSTPVRPAVTYVVDEVTADLLSIAALPSGKGLLSTLDTADLARLQTLGIVAEPRLISR